MKQVLDFFKSTKRVSRVLFFLWIFFSIFTKFSNETRIQIILEFGVLFLIPAVIVEVIKNPTIRKHTDISNPRSNNGFLEMCKNLNAVSIVLILYWIFYIIFISTYMKSEIFEATGMGLAILCYVSISLFLWVPVILIEIKKNPVLLNYNETRMASSNKTERYISKSKIATIVFGSLSSVGGIITLIDTSNVDESLPPTIIFFIAAVFSGIISINSPKTKSEAEERKRKKVVFNAVKSDESSVTKLYNSETDEYDYNEYDKFTSNDVSLFDSMNGHEFEYFCAGILKENGFSNVRVTPGSGDQGVDILATKDGIKYAIQCKNYASSLGNTPIQEVHAGKAFYNCHVGVVMTNSIFTTGAKELAKATGVLLWDRTTLQKMIEEAEPTIDIED